MTEPVPSTRERAFVDRHIGLSDDDVAAMERALAEAGEDEDRFHLDFALGKAWEERGDADRAFAHYAAGNALRRCGIVYDADATEAFVDASITLATPDFFAAWAYDAVTVLGNAIKAANSTDPEAIRKAMIDTKGFQGAEGPYNFDASGEGLHGYNIVQNKDGALVFVKRVEAAK